MDDLITVTELCRLLRLTRRAVDRRRKEGRLGIPELNLGGDGRQAIPRFRRRDVEQYLRSREV
ncbi:helix-turn-helix domain-containing protein [Sphingomonas melonis]